MFSFGGFGAATPAQPALFGAAPPKAATNLFGEQPKGKDKSPSKPSKSFGATLAAAAATTTTTAKIPPMPSSPDFKPTFSFAKADAAVPPKGGFFATTAQPAQASLPFSIPAPTAAASSTKKGTGVADLTLRKLRNTALLSLMEGKPAPLSSGEPPKPILSPFGFFAIPAPKKLAKSDSALTHVLAGPLNDRWGGTCWLDAILALGLSLEPLQEWALDTTRKPHPIAGLYVRWIMEDQTTFSFRKKVNNGRKNVWELFISKGFERGKSFDVIKAFKTLLTEIEKAMEKKGPWMLVVPGKQHEIPQENPPQYIIVFNSKYGALPRDLQVEGYEILSFITFEEIRSKKDFGEEINHFMTVALTEEGYFIYDDLLNLSPGGFQGGFVPKNAECYDSNLDTMFSNVPILILRRKNIQKGSKIEVPPQNPSAPSLRRSLRKKIVD
jgi:hypothetical protein